jgi:dipeptidyl-peptidase-3
MAYSAAVFQNNGNYKSFGDSKFVPELPREDFREFIGKTEAYKSH